MYNEPTHDRGSRTTASSAAEGRLKESYLSKRKKKRKIIKDGIGGCGAKKKKY